MSLPQGPLGFGGSPDEAVQGRRRDSGRLVITAEMSSNLNRRVLESRARSLLAASRSDLNSSFALLGFSDSHSIKPSKDRSHDFHTFDRPWTSTLRRCTRGHKTVARLVDRLGLIIVISAELLPHPLRIDAIQVRTLILASAQFRWCRGAVIRPPSPLHGIFPYRTRMQRFL